MNVLDMRQCVSNITASNEVTQFASSFEEETINNTKSLVYEMSTITSAADLFCIIIEALCS